MKNKWLHASMVGLFILCFARVGGAFPQRLNLKKFRLGTSRIQKFYLLNLNWHNDLRYETNHGQRKVLIRQRKKLLKNVHSFMTEVLPGKSLEVEPEYYAQIYEQTSDRVGNKWEGLTGTGRHFKGKISGFLLYRSEVDRGNFQGLTLFAILTPDKTFVTFPAQKAATKGFYNLIAYASRSPKAKIATFKQIEPIAQPASLSSYWIGETLYTDLDLRDRHTTMRYQFWDNQNKKDNNYYLSFSVREFADPESHRGLYRVSVAKNRKKIKIKSPVVPVSHSDQDGCLDIAPTGYFILADKGKRRGMFMVTCDCFKGEYAAVLEITKKGSRVVAYSEQTDPWKRNW